MQEIAQSEEYVLICGSDCLTVREEAHVQPQHEDRRLTTILAADVVGYSRLMASDESGTLAQALSR